MDDLLARCADLPVRELAPGEVLLPEGAAPGPLYVLRSGSLEIRTGGRLLSRVEQPGSFLGEVSVLLGSPTTAAVVADGPASVHVLQDAATLLAERPDLLLEVARLLARRVTALTVYLSDVREQYADTEGHLGMMDRVLSALVVQGATGVEPGSERADVPGY